MPKKAKPKKKKRLKPNSEAVQSRFRNFDGKRYAPKAKKESGASGG